MFSRQLRDRVIGVRDFQNHLEAVDELIPQKLREPRLFVDFKKSQPHIQALTQSVAYFSRSIASEREANLRPRRLRRLSVFRNRSRRRMRALCTCDFEFPTEHPNIPAISSCLYP